MAGFTAAKDDGSGADNWSYKTCTALAKSSSPTSQHDNFLQARRYFCHPTNSVKALKGKQFLSLNYMIKL